MLFGAEKNKDNSLLKHNWENLSKITGSLLLAHLTVFVGYETDNKTLLLLS